MVKYVPDLDVPHKVHLLIIDLLTDLALEGALCGKGLFLVRISGI